MKQVVFIGKEKGYITPERQAEFLSRHGHLEGIDGSVKYYTYNGGGFKVIHVGGQVAQVEKINPDDIKLILRCSEIKFGGF